ncbi:TonB-dependent receptor [candidate division KSB1 bacterium]|nr:TonB-dependent receptor [candidate division KSB1 bacterium]
MKNLDWKVGYFLVVLFLFTLNFAYPQETDSTKTVVSISETPRADTLTIKPRPNSGIWVSDTREMEKLIAEDIADFVQVLPPVFPLDYGSLGQVSPLSFRGSTPQQTSIWLDALNLENPISGFVPTTVIPINVVEDFTVRGADSFAPFGFQSSGGILQVNSFKFDTKEPYSKVNYRAGSWGYSDLGIIFALPITKNVNFTFSGKRQGFDGFEVNRMHTGSRIFGRVSFQPHSKMELNYTVFLNKNEFEIPAPLLPAFVPLASGAKRKDKRFDQALSLKLGSLSEENKLLNASLFFSTIQEQSIADSVAFKPRNMTFGTRIQQQIIAGNHLFGFGGEFKTDDLSSPRLGDHTDKFGRVFIQDDFLLTDKWRLGLQLNLDRKNDYPIGFNPAAFLYYEPTEINKIWVGIRRAQRYPSFVERFWPTSDFRGDPELSAERSSTFELGFSLNSDDVQVHAAAFVQQVDSWIGNTVLANLEDFGPVNSGKRTVLGHDFKFIWKYFKGGEFGFVSSYVTVTEPGPSKRLQVPEISIYSYLDLGSPMFENYVYVNLRLIGRIFGERSGLTYENSPSLPSVVKLPEATVFDGQISFQFSDARLSISMENLFDKKYQMVPGFFMPPKTFRFGISWEFWD